jgi:hypothetical protein
MILQHTFEHLRQEEEESEENSTSEESDTENDAIAENIPMGIPTENQQRVHELLAELRRGQYPDEPNRSHVNASDAALNVFNYKDFPALRRARAKLAVKAKDNNIDVTFRSRIVSMVGTLNLYLDPELSYTWRDASLVVARSQGLGIQIGSKRARNIRTWIHRYLINEKLPFHSHGQYHSSILDHEDFAQDIQLHLTEIAKDGYIRAQDIVDFIATPRMQERLGSKARGISVRTARRWLKKLDWRYGRKKNGMYIDGHEREDVVKYREEFLARWQEYEKRMVTYNNDGDIDFTPTGFPVPQGSRFRLILVTHDESTFYANDRRKTQWNHAKDKATPQRKGEGPSLMISDMLTSEWGRLRDGEE